MPFGGGGYPGPPFQEAAVIRMMHVLILLLSLYVQEDALNEKIFYGSGSDCSKVRSMLPCIKLGRMQTPWYVREHAYVHPNLALCIPNRLKRHRM